MSEKSQVNLHDTMDAAVWAEEWMKVIKKHPGVPTDEGTMIGWFANAIEAGYGQAMRDYISAAKRPGLHNQGSGVNSLPDFSTGGF